MRVPFKYSGGKSSELKYITPYIPSATKRIVEPFCGACAVSFNSGLPALVTDTRPELITTLQVIQSRSLWPHLQRRLDPLRANTSTLEQVYYHHRDNMVDCTDPLDVAMRFIIFRMLGFSGMERVNKKNKCNVPFGHYKQFSIGLSDVHHELMQDWTIKLQSYEQTFDELEPDDWVFLDPPYAGRQSQYGIWDADFDHTSFQPRVDALTHPWLLIHSRHTLYDEFIDKYNVWIKPHKYKTNYKTRSSTPTDHLYISSK